MDFGEGFLGEGAIDEVVDFGEGPDVAVGKFHDDAEVTEFWRNEAVGFLVAVEWVGEVVGAVEEEDGALDGAEVLGGVEVLEPEGAGLGGHAGEGAVFPDAVVPKVAAAVNRDSGFEA